MLYYMSVYSYPCCLVLPLVPTMVMIKLLNYYKTVQADRIQRAQDERKANSEREIHQMEGDNHKGRGKGRSVFRQVAKGLGVISEHKATHGRYLMFFYCT